MATNLADSDKELKQALAEGEFSDKKLLPPKSSFVGAVKPEPTN
jgi:hypothetical protein